MKPVKLVVLVVIFLSFSAAQPQHEPHFWNNRSTIVHLFEWKWNDIADECERFLAPRGFGGVQVSPANENIMVSNNSWWVPVSRKAFTAHRPWWERYQPISYELITRSGNETEFADMVRRCNSVGIRIYVDVILNHMAADQNYGTGTGGSLGNPNARSFPAVPFNVNDFHTTCDVSNYSDPFQLRNCEHFDRKDLDQSSDRVCDILVEFLDHLVQLGIAGFRIDAAMYMEPEDLAVIYARVQNLNTAHGFEPNSRPFIFQEVVDYGEQPISKYDYIQFGAVTEFMFSVEISRAFGGGNKLKWLRSWGRQWGFLPSESALVFVDNHVNQRDGNVLTYKTPKQYRMATAFALAYPYGISRIMSSFEFTGKDDSPPANADESLKSPLFDDDGACTNGWVCEHRWRQIYNMIEFKNVVHHTGIHGWWDNHNNQIAFCRGTRGFVAFNGDTYDLKQTLETCLPAGRYCDVISGTINGSTCTGKVVTVGWDGKADIEIGINENDGVLAIHEKSRL